MYAPRDYKKALRTITQPLFVVVGASEELFFFAEKFEPIISEVTKVKVNLVPGLSHMGVVVNPLVQPIIKEWLQTVGGIGQRAS